MVNYGIVYGLSAYGLADRLASSRRRRRSSSTRYLERFPAVKEFIDATIAKATDEGFVATLFGRIRRVPELRARQRQTRMLGERLAVNMVIQGTAADIIKVAMVSAAGEAARRGPGDAAGAPDPRRAAVRGPGGGGRAGVRDRGREMAGAFEMDPPLEVDVASGANWLEAK